MYRFSCSVEVDGLARWVDVWANNEEEANVAAYNLVKHNAVHTKIVVNEKFTYLSAVHLLEFSTGVVDG